MNEKIQALLERDVLRNIILLKTLAAYPEVADCHVVGNAVLVLLPVRVSPFDRQTYPGVDTIVMLAGEDPEELRALLPAIPRDERLVFKLNHPNQVEVFRPAFRLRRAIAYISYTAPQESHFEPDAQVVITRRPDEGCLALFAAQGYGQEEIAEDFAQAVAHAFAIYTQGRPACACMAYRNHDRVFEIGALHTLPGERRTGYARRVVLTALAWVMGSGCVPRYAVHEQNEASMRLAESVGLVRFLTTEHWVFEEPRYNKNP